MICVSGIKLYAIGVGLKKTRELYAIVDDNKFNVFELDTYKDLSNITSTLLDKICSGGASDFILSDQAKPLEIAPEGKRTVFDSNRQPDRGDG